MIFQLESIDVTVHQDNSESSTQTHAQGQLIELGQSKNQLYGLKILQNDLSLNVD